jgi:hypothetical protein
VYPRRALTDHPPAAETARQPRTESRSDAARGRTARRRVALLVTGVVVLLAIVAGVVLLGGGEVPLIDSGPTGPGEFAFQLGDVVPASTSDTPSASLRDAAREAGDDVKATMDELYLRAFVDTDQWGDYEGAFAMFDDSAGQRAQADAAVLTLGRDANDVYDAIGPASGDLQLSILMDGKDRPVTAIAQVDFVADAERSDGGTTEIQSTGSFFLRKIDGEWRVFAYRVDRGDQASGAPSASGSPS